MRENKLEILSNMYKIHPCVLFMTPHLCFEPLLYIMSQWFSRSIPLNKSLRPGNLNRNANSWVPTLDLLNQKFWAWGPSNLF